MTIEELAINTNERKYSLRAEKTYDNIRKMRNEVLMRSFLCKNNTSAASTVATVGGVDYINASEINNLNAAWLMFEKTNKNIIWIIQSSTVSDKDTQMIQQTLNGKIKKVMLISDNDSEILPSVLLAKSIATNEDCVIFTVIDKNIADREEKARIFSQTVYSL